MPIAGGISPLQSQLKGALSMGNGAQVASTSQLFAAGVASIVPMGMFPIAPVPVPLAPAGMSAGASLIQNALSMGNGATIDAVSQMIAMGISVIAPVAPPAGLSILAQQIKGALSLGNGATVDSTAMMIALAVPTYYMAGGVL